MIESADEFARLCHSDDRGDNLRARTEEALEPTWLSTIDRFPEWRVEVARNKTVPISVLERLVADPDRLVRLAIAAKRKATPELLERLARDPYESIRLQVARHKNTPLPVLESLRNDPWDEVRSAVEARLGV
jgi:hypothetical protein